MSTSTSEGLLAVMNAMIWFSKTTIPDDPRVLRAGAAALRLAASFCLQEAEQLEQRAGSLPAAPLLHSRPGPKSGPAITLLELLQRMKSGGAS